MFIAYNLKRLINILGRKDFNRYLKRTLERLNSLIYGLWSAFSRMERLWTGKAEGRNFRFGFPRLAWLGYLKIQVGF